MVSAARKLFCHLIRRPDQQVPLAEAALAIAWEDQGGKDPRPCLALLDSFAADLCPRLADLSDGRTIITAINHYLFHEQGFYGDPHSYDQPDPANSYLDQVLLRRRGLPILLSLIYLELGWRLKLPVSGLALPGHFIVRYGEQGHELFVDPFRGGALWTIADCERQIASFYGEITASMVTWMMAPPARGAILARILRNLKQTYLVRDDVTHALNAVERLLILDGSDAGELRDRGLLRFRAGQTFQALEDLERYARNNPGAADLDQIRSFARDLVARIAPKN